MSTPGYSPNAEHRLLLRLEVPCEFTAVRGATQQVCAWLAERGLPETELDAWELTLVEAVNNAVKYASSAARKMPVSVEVSCGLRDVEMRVTDHTAGFEWPAEITLPAEDAEHGRGLYLMQSLMAEVFYLRHPAQNVLVLRRPRPVGGHELFPDASQLQQQLADAETALTEMTAELAVCYESLVALFRYSAELGTQTDLHEFAGRLLRDLMQIAEADAAVLRLVAADGSQLETIFSAPETATILPPVAWGKNSEAAEVGAARNRQDIWFSPEEPLPEDDPLRALMPVGHGVCHAFFVADQLVGTATLGRRAAEKPFTAAQVNLLHSFLDFFAIQTVNARLLEERTHTQVTQRKIQIAADIQRSLLPAHLPACPPFALAASCESAHQVGGDFYDAIPASDGAVLLVIADVMGKGVPAALFAAVLRGTIRSMPQLFSAPGELLAAANRTLFPDLSRVDMFITAQAVYLNPARAELVAASAGHCPLLVWRPGAAAAVTAGHAGLPLGIEPATTYPQTVTPCGPGTAALLYTDGLSELRNATGEMLAENKLTRLFAEAAAQTWDADTGKNFLLARLAAYRGEAPLADDQTFLLIRHLA